MILNLSGHLGTNVSALVDGQLSAEDEEKAWEHVLTCPGCRQRVEHEGWLKQSLACLGGHARGDEHPATGALTARLYDAAAQAWAHPGETDTDHRRHRFPLALVGAGSIGLAVAGLMALSSPPAGRGEVPGGVRTGLQTTISNALTPGVDRAPRPGTRTVSAVRAAR